MKKGLVILLLFFSTFSFSQIYIKGKVTSSANEPLEGASVYFNNTTIGSITNSKGEFELKISKGNYTLVVSFLGFKTKQFPINVEETPLNLTIKLQEENDILNEVVIHKTVYDEDWKYNLKRFKQAFLGRTKLASTCKILNEKDLHFNFNRKTNTLTAIAKKTLIIKHNGLGYLITYDLIDFSIQKNRLFFSGYAQYKNLRKKIKSKWKKNRLEAFNGSRMHFLRSLINKNIDKEGFLVNQFKRVPNPDRPSEQKIEISRQLIQLHKGKINFNKQIIEPKTTIDSAIIVLRKASLPKYQDYLYKRNVIYSDMISFEKNKPFLNFQDYLSIIYKNESEENNYLLGLFGKRKKASGVQTSNIILLEGKSQIDNTGILINPNAIFNEGYWAFEAFANMLPLDYQPPKD
ncbi:hypothetical protein WH52_12165 [Tenacibaculum holothuriorum]|uniref:Carboxypeptidase-like regulatory domain-containing protein n=1 Tax=Tenacibaculum holothuriorum TaxID=1635173 RepID=A0A1Y2P9V5_9FLAO|nr:carboxypeptidase-like regulatory domain-containing protein [Tenacibaculum holothuriorum]OSY87212.1 hypothetical protein WH52_12165 [Tenacibaculum holothuriorum]